MTGIGSIRYVSGMWLRGLGKWRCAAAPEMRRKDTIILFIFVILFFVWTLLIHPSAE